MEKTCYDLNIEVAVLRRYKVEDDLCARSSMHGGFRGRPPRNWAEDIKDAWELLEEMGGIQLIRRKDKYLLIPSSDELPWVEDKSASKCIVLAYLDYMRNMSKK